MNEQSLGEDSTIGFLEKVYYLFSCRLCSKKEIFIALIFLILGVLDSNYFYILKTISDDSDLYIFVAILFCIYVLPIFRIVLLERRSFKQVVNSIREQEEKVNDEQARRVAKWTPRERLVRNFFWWVILAAFLVYLCVSFYY